MTKRPDKPTYVFKSFVNSFHYLYQDAEYLSQTAHSEEMVDRFERTRLSRTAILLFVLSLEGLINRAIDHFLPEPIRDFIVNREERLSLEDKWLVLPLLATQGAAQFDTSRYPWTHFAELVRLRNDFVHPKHDRPVYYQAVTPREWKPLAWNKIPKGLKVQERDVIYRQSRIPKDPYAIRPEHVDIVKNVVDDIVRELDRLMGGRISGNDWAISDQMTLIYPPGATLDDLVHLPNPQRRKE